MPAIVSDRDPICMQCLKIFKHLESDRVENETHRVFIFLNFLLLWILKLLFHNFINGLQSSHM